MIAKRTLTVFVAKHADAREPLFAWHALVSRLPLEGVADIKHHFPSASFVANNRIVFNIKGNHYRLIVVALFQAQVMYIRFVGTHREYDRVDATTV